MLPVASSPSDVLTATSIAAFIKINDTGGGGRLLFPESDDEDNYSDNGSVLRQRDNPGVPIFDLFRLVNGQVLTLTL